MTATTFSRYGWAGKSRCDVCGATGYDPDTCQWAERHKRGHAPCPHCGRMLTVKLDGSPRVHTRCPSPAKAQ